MFYPSAPVWICYCKTSALGREDATVAMAKSVARIIFGNGARLIDPSRPVNHNGEKNQIGE